MGINEQTPLK